MHNILTLIKALCTKNGITISDLERALNVASSSMYKWDRISPSIDKIRAVADYFNVSIDYVLGRTNIPTPIDQAFSDPQLVTIQRLRENLSPVDKEKMMNMMRIQFSEDFPISNEDDDNVI